MEISGCPSGRRVNEQLALRPRRARLARTAKLLGSWQAALHMLVPCPHAASEFSSCRLAGGDRRGDVGGETGRQVPLGKGTRWLQFALKGKSLFKHVPEN